MLLKIKEAFEYDELTSIEAGVYEFVQEGINGWPMIKVDDEWLDIVNIEEFEILS